MRILTLLVLWLAALSLLGFGVAFLVQPLETMAAAGVALQGEVAATEVMAFYGGLEVALGAVLGAAALQPSHRRAGLLLSFAVFAGIGLARLAGMLLTGADTDFLRFALATELGLALLSAIAWRGTRAAQR